jgi:hypothetical protein
MAAQRVKVASPLFTPFCPPADVSPHSAYRAAPVNLVLHERRQCFH